MKDKFSQQSSFYAQYRPGYPVELFDFILQFVPHKKTAWDCATGNGQSALALSKHFEKVIATDISSKQLDNAEKAMNVFYSLQPAEHTDIENNTIDLITVAQAIHWFQFDEFYAEARRVSASNAVLAVWCYTLLRINEPINEIMDEYHFTELANYWDAERKYVDERYRNIPFPFEKIETPSFAIQKHWTIDELEGYLNTWSALQKYIAANGCNPVPELIKKLAPHWGNAAKQEIIFPIHLLLGTIK
ncbi:MAG: class I SAM-dependent methyltransferase [Chitinophagaceae bacterium]|nr:class I SAM-dependent methyltransferase [Chitinophagaceae bacterium]